MEKEHFRADGRPPPRLMITKMELENFKSYAGVREIGPFHKCFSAVVGPNGSGKSNVIDAMLFVFGKRAKKLRLNKVSELIHKSDAVRDNPPTSARVSVFFQDIIDTGDGDNDYELVPGTETVVSRIAKHDNSSSYKLNGKNCQFKDVAVYLDSKGVDLDNNRFLILQGEVEMISMMAPKGKNEDDVGLLEYLEEIIGSSKFVEETNLAAEQVESLTEVRQEKLNRVKVVEREKESLESAKQEAESLLAKDREIRRKKNILYQIQSMKAKTESDRCKQQKSEVDLQLEEERDNFKRTEGRVKELEKGLKAQQKEYNKAYDELVKTREEFASYERKDIKLREEISHLQNQEKKADNKIKAESKKESEAMELSRKAAESIPELEDSIKNFADKKATEDAVLDKLYEKMKEETQKLRSELEAKSHELAPIQQERAAYQANLDTALTKVQLLEDSTKRAKERLEKAEYELANIDRTEQQKRDELSKAEEELRQCKERIGNAEREESSMAEKEGKLTKHFKVLMEQAEEAKAAVQSQSGIKNQAVQGILKAAKNGGPLSKVGVLGRLGDLATISPEYDVAVSTACGMLDHIVVQTTAGAQRCLEFLRQHNLGRANFIPLDKMKKGAHDTIVQTPEDAPRLFELISPVNFSITPAIFLAVANTLVAPDLETATRLAYDYSKRWRVVTLDGKLIETAGTMTGGGNSVRRGGMRLTNSRSLTEHLLEQEGETLNSKKIEQQAEKVQSLLQECRLCRKKLNDELKDLIKRIKQLDLKISKINMEISAFDGTRNGLATFIPQLRSQCSLSAEDSAQLEELNKEVQKCKSDMKSCTTMASKLEAEVANLQKAILDAGGSEMKKQQVICEKALKDLNNAEKALASAKVAITTNKKNATKAKKALEVSRKELDECVLVLEKKNEALVLLEKDALAVKESFKEVQKIEEERRAVLEEASKECDELKKSMAEIKCKEIELLGQSDALTKQLLDSEKSYEKWEKELNNLRSIASEDDDSDSVCAEGGKDGNVVESTNRDSNSNALENHDGEDDEMLDGRKDDKESSLYAHSPLPVLPFSTLEKYDKQELMNSIGVLESERNTIAKNANMGAIAEYRKKEADYLARVEELDNVTEHRNEARKKHEDLRRQRLEMFMDGFGQITLRLKEMYQMITLGGDAELELVDSLDPFSEGIVFSVRPPKKSWKNISNLSGGEKTLSSLALVFALHHFKPTPLYVMDEIDAALDFKNVSIVANYIKERTRNAQFIIISLRNNMFELADRLVGIYKTNNCTNSVTIDPRAFGNNDKENGAPATPILTSKTNVMKSAVKGNVMASAASHSKTKVTFEND